ncbi:polymorphic toxin-type HINT domain-containing protein [Embleya sp. NBC_00888]|uniref:polymorphic toxin-type HINT domain-containing protein n=1 Tax=Embleya sp. NBC_00888 TaxID=2975960 RepID=UPI003865FFE4|nr:polymorphic toxin-type HINT domain-containing protein [Embleya sp. NBC_00888]
MTQAPSTATVGGPDPYWQSFDYDAVGNRIKLVEHDVTDDPAKNVTTEYGYRPGAQAGDRTHRLETVTLKTGTREAVTTGLTYDANGSVKTRPGADANLQTLTWNEEDKLTKVDSATGTSESLYDADGTRIIRREAGKTTLYLGGDELTTNSNGTGPVVGTRYYPTAGGSTVVRSGSGALIYVAADHHGTPTSTLDAADLTATRRQSKPFGEPRGTQPTQANGQWPDDKGFLGKPMDSTGLTHVGAREYDPTLGRFISVDPLMDLTDNQQMHGYTYSGNNPATVSDPTGLFGIGEAIGAAAGGEDKKQKKRQHRAAETAKRKGSNPVTTISYQSGRSGKHSSAGTGTSGFRTADSPEQLPADLSLAVAAAAVALTGTLADRCRKERWFICSPNTLLEGFSWGWRWGSRGGDDGDCHSFLPDTGVLMADGSAKPIREVEPGDSVLSTDPQTGESKPRTVLASITTEDDKEFAEITVRTDRGDASIIATTNHPFWIPDLKQWVNAGDLEPGQWLQTASGTWVQVSAVQVYTNQRRTYDLTVDTDHTYHVLAGATPVLVHNCEPGKLTDDAREAYENIEAGLPKWTEENRKTHGAIVDEAGRVQGRMSSGEANYESSEIDNYLRFLADTRMPGVTFPRDGNGVDRYPTSSHVEVKVAWEMRKLHEENVNVNIIINHPKGVCTGGAWECSPTVPYLLPRNSSLTVWHRTPSGLTSQVIYSIDHKNRK